MLDCLSINQSTCLNSSCMRWSIVFFSIIGNWNISNFAWNVMAINVIGMTFILNWCYINKINWVVFTEPIIQSEVVLKVLHVFVWCTSLSSFCNETFLLRQNICSVFEFAEDQISPQQSNNSCVSLPFPAEDLNEPPFSVDLSLFTHSSRM